jgi:hypothetical protein
MRFASAGFNQQYFVPKGDQFLSDGSSTHAATNDTEASLEGCIGFELISIDDHKNGFCNAVTW